MFGYERKESNKTAIAVATGIGALALVLGALALARSPELRRRLGLGNGYNSVTEASEDSFPASDAPSWTATTSLGSLH